MYLFGEVYRGATLTISRLCLDMGAVRWLERGRRAEFEYLCLGAYTSVEVVSSGFGDREAPFCESYCRAAE